MTFTMDMSTPDRRRIGRPFAEKAHRIESYSLDLVELALQEAQTDLATLERKALLIDLRREATEELILCLKTRARLLHDLHARFEESA